MVNEIWKPIINYENLYHVSNFGRIKRLIGWKCDKERILKPTINCQDGYYQIDLWENNIRRRFRVHLIILNIFSGPKPFPKAVCRHLDGNQLNNNISNLKWGTVKENIQDQLKHGVFRDSKGSKHNMAIINEDIAQKIKTLIKEGIRMVDISKILNVSINIVHNIKYLDSWSHVK